MRKYTLRSLKTGLMLRLRCDMRCCTAQRATVRPPAPYSHTLCPTRRRLKKKRQRQRQPPIRLVMWTSRSSWTILSSRRCTGVWGDQPTAHPNSKIGLSLQATQATQTAHPTASPSGRSAACRDFYTVLLVTSVCRDRLAAMKQEVERRAALERAGHGSYTEVAEGDFLEVVTQTRAVVVHFYHRDFERCKILDKHLAILARKHMAPRFIKLHAPVRVAV